VILEKGMDPDRTDNEPSNIRVTARLYTYITCIYCVLVLLVLFFVLFRLCIYIYICTICFVTTSLRTTATE